MARYVQDVVLNKPDNFVFYIVNDFLQKNGFVMSDWKGEPAYRTGDPMLTGYRYLKYSYTNGVFHLEAWMKGTFGGEWDLDGFVGCAQKGPYKENLNLLLQTLQQPLPQQQSNMPSETSTQSAQTAQPAPAVIPVRTVDNQNAATLGLVFGILSIVLSCIPILGLVFGILGITQARMGQGSSKSSMAQTGKICAMVGLSLTGCMFMLNVGSVVLSFILELSEM